MRKLKFLLFAIALMPTASNAAMIYRVEQRNRPVEIPDSGLDNQSFARTRRFYVGGMYDFSMWNGYMTDGDAFIGGKNATSFDVVAGLRPYDFFRLELDYIHNKAKWSDFSLTGQTAMINALFDARINNLYRLFYRQRLVPYVGAGAGAMWVSADNIEIGRKVVPTMAALAGLGIELGDWFAIDAGYRYFYSFTPQFQDVSGLNPSAHQFRVGARASF